MKKKKTFYVEYAFMYPDDDGVYEYSGHIYAEDKIDAQQTINQFGLDTGAIDSYTDVIKIAKAFDMKDD